MHCFHNLKFFGFASFPLIIVLGLSELFDWLIPCGPFEFEPAQLEEPVMSAVIKAEYIWGTSVVVLMTVCSWVIVYCARVILRSDPPNFAIQLLLVTILLSVVAASSLLWPPLDFDNCISRQVFESTLKSLDSGKSGVTALEVLVSVLISSQVFGVVTVLFVAIASCSVLTVTRRDVDLTWQDLERRTSHLRGVLYAGAFGLVALLVQLQAFFAIPESVLAIGSDADPNPEIEVLKDLADGLKVFWGSALTLVLVAVFVPPAAVLHVRSLSLARESNPDAKPSEIDDWMRDRGLMEPWTTQLAKALAMLSPLLSGPLASVVGSLAGIEI